MKRDIELLNNTSFDVIVIGAGIYGAAISRLLARNGYRTALIEKGDFGQATSANSLKILHGGLRYLQHLNLKRMRESIACRRDLMQFSPHLTRPLSCLMPTRGHAMRSKPVMATAFLLNDLISWDRNRDLPPSLQLQRGAILAEKTFRDILPGLADDEITGAANWFDGLAENTERIVIEHLLDASDYGACLANYVQADSITVDNDQITGVVVTDQLTNKQFSITAQLVINAAGPWFAELLKQSGLPIQPCLWAKAINIVVKKQLHPTYAIGLESREDYQDRDAVFRRGKRLYFFVPWRNHTMIGTTYTSFPKPADELKFHQRDIDEIIQEVNAIYPDYHLGREDVTFVHCGLVPMSNSPDHDKDVQLKKNTLIIDHEEQDGYGGLISIQGVKYTTAPHTADKILQLVQQKLPMSSSEQQSPASPLQSEQTNTTPSVRLQKKYGRFAERVQHYIQQDNGNRKLDPEQEIVHGEIIYFIREEMALNISDIIFRRSDLGTAQCPADELIDKICQIMTKELLWNKQEQASQIEAISAAYTPLPLHQ